MGFGVWYLELDDWCTWLDVSYEDKRGDKGRDRNAKQKCCSQKYRRGPLPERLSASYRFCANLFEDFAFNLYERRPRNDGDGGNKTEGEKVLVKVTFRWFKMLARRCVWRSVSQSSQKVLQASCEQYATT